MEVEVSNGELVDKITILDIKSRRIKDIAKVNNVIREMDSLMMKSATWWKYWEPEIFHLFKQLLDVNEKLWGIEDKIRELDKEVFPLEQYGDASSIPFLPYYFLPAKVCEYMECARMVYTLNDERSKIKREINDITRSGIVEEKSHF